MRLAYPFVTVQSSFLLESDWNFQRRMRIMLYVYLLKSTNGLSNECIDYNRTLPSNI